MTGWGSVVAGALIGIRPSDMSAQQPAAPSLVFDRVNVVDVERGKFVAGQRVVITGNHIQAVGSTSTVASPKGAQVVDARGKYLIPGLWDMHIHPYVLPEIVYTLLLTNGITGFRSMGTGVPLDTLHQWQREILTGTRVGPPRQLLAGPSLNEHAADFSCRLRCFHGIGPQLSVQGAERARHVVDSLQAAGADFIKVRSLSLATYWAIVAEAHRVGIPFAGHLPNTGFGEGRDTAMVLVASDSGQRTIEHDGGLRDRCEGDAASLERCRPIAERHRRNGTWDVLGPLLRTFSTHTSAEERWRRQRRFWPDSATRDWGAPPAGARAPHPRRSRHLEIAERAGLPLLIGTDCGGVTPLCDIPGFQLHNDLSVYVDWGLTPLTALQAVTLNPAKMLGVTDSLGTVAPGKLADLVLLDADPLADIWNTTTIRAVVANGRYFDRAALDRLLAALAAAARRHP